jgi:nicotinamide mononucleotide (NMN) deamidase PncC
MSNRAKRLHDSPWLGVFYLTGGGVSLLAEMLGLGGASRTVLEARIPYAAKALAELLGTEPEQACSEVTARALAMSAFQRARHLSIGPEPGPTQSAPTTAPFGLACTASLATDRTKRGQHRAHAAIQTREATYTALWTFSGTREEEERALTERLWAKLGQALAIDGVGESIEIRHTAGKPAWQALILGESQALATADHDGRLLLPGAFNPLHDAHRQMLTIAEELTDLAGAYELSVANVDKPFLDYREIESRLAQFDRPVWLTRLPTFLEKARQFPGATFVVGIDTLIRIAEPKYYGNPAMRDEALAELAEFGVRWLVFGREIDGHFRVLSDFAASLPKSLVDRAEEVGADRFRNPASSTSIRRRGSSTDSNS